MDATLVRRHVRLDAQGDEVLSAAYERSRLSARGHDRVLKVARTLADLDGADRVAADHVSRALNMRVEQTSVQVVA
jgi:magnesium chelatase family protein